MTAGAPGENGSRAGRQRLSPAGAGSKPRRPKFDKAASTTVLLAALLGLGAGATWQLGSVAPRAQGPAEDELVPVGPAGALTRVLVVDTTGLVVAAFDSASIRTVGGPTAAVALSRGRSKAPVAASRAS